MPATDQPPDTIVLIHGLWLTSLSWNGWAARYRNRGYRVLTPNWPGMDADVATLNADPAPIADLTLDRIIDHHQAIIAGLDRPPIIMGHSFGGTFTQVLLDRGFGAAGVGVASAAVKGVRDLPLSTIRVAAPGLNPFRQDEGVPLTAKEFHYAFANTLPQEESDALYHREHVPASSTVLRQYALANFRHHPPTEVDFTRPDRAPLLFIAFGEDHLMPPGVVGHNERKYDDTTGTSAYREFPGRPHHPGVPGWDEVADYAIGWVERHTGRPRT